ncbi:hypothetical protein E1162_04095 [Rhodobacteraceae bacterium RKSG542]|uniref:hypothetical protein n=1 Tax=Pseudovibrio flavus TaxID=2529854 RepID=UPI0012BD46F6|nr:hypothetical protein [Pseudovibrio flavus]MTI16418.1 hypothetical protein [Pseudovibrio flavus]
MKKVFGALALIATVAMPLAASADNLDTRHMSCSQAQSYVQHEGSTLLFTGDQLYNRYVANGYYCNPTEQAVSQSVPTLDSNTCHIDVCQEKNSGN